MRNIITHTHWRKAIIFIFILNIIGKRKRELKRERERRNFLN